MDVTISPLEAAEAGCKASVIDAGHETGSEGSMSYEYTWYRASAKGEAVSDENPYWVFDHWEWKYHIETSSEAGNDSREFDKKAYDNPLERRDAFDFGDWNSRGGSYDYHDHSYADSIVAVFRLVQPPQRPHHDGTGLPIYNTSTGEICCRDGMVAYDNDIN